MKILQLLKSGKYYSFISSMNEPQYSHVEIVSISIYYQIENERFIRKQLHDKHTSNEKFRNEIQEELSEEELIEKISKITSDFWGIGVWGENIDTEEKILQNIS